MALDPGKCAILLTGASSGIGEATALALARRGARLGLVARRVERLAEVAERCAHAGAAEVEAWVCDLGDLDAAEHVARSADAHFGGVDVLVNNAGVPKRRRVQDLGAHEAEATMAVNHFAPVRMTLAVLPGMLARRRGSIVNVSSLGGRLGIQGEAAYCASKFAMCGWTESMLADLHDTGVDVRLVLPGAIDTEIWDQPGNDPAAYDGPFEPPSKVADAIVAAIEGDAVEHYVPDLRAVVELKNTDLEGFVEGMVQATDAMRSRTRDGGIPG